MMFLQSFVTPIFTYVRNAAGEPEALNLMGTGCFVGKGILLTAAHVLQNASVEIAAGSASGVCANPQVPKEGGGSSDLFIDILKYEIAERPYDIALAATDYSIQGDRVLGRIKVEIAHDVAALGYPESAFQKHQGKLYVQARVHR